MSKWKCRPCGGGGDEGKCIWCGGTGRPSFQQAYMLGLSVGQDRGEEPFHRKGWPGMSRHQWIGTLLEILNDYGNTAALDAAFPGDTKFSKLLKNANEGNVEALMDIVHRMRTIYEPKALDALLGDRSVAYLIDEISPLRGR